MSSVTFSTTVGGDGSTVTDDDNATTGLGNGGALIRLVPMLQQTVNVAAHVVSVAGGTGDDAIAAENSAIAAASSANLAAAAYDSFDDRYLGAKSSDPSTDNDGNALITGAFYWNTSLGVMKVWTGSGWYAFNIATGYLSLAGGTMTGNIVFNSTQFGTNIETFLKTPNSANLAAALTDETGTGKLVFATSPTLVTPILGTPTSGNLSNCTADGTNSVGYLNIPQNIQSANYTLVLSDSGKQIFHPSADTTARTFTIPANSSVGYPIGTELTVINQFGAGTVTLASTDTLRLANTGTTGNALVSTGGMAQLIKVTATEWLVNGATKEVPTTIGQAYGGGFYAGKINVSGTQYYLIVAPKSTGEASGKKWGTVGSTTGITSVINGPTNSASLAALGADYQAAIFCEGLTIGGYSDWYLPSKNELEVLYYNLKPTTTANDTSSGLNDNAVSPEPVSTNYTSGSPAQTSAGIGFRTGETDAFASVYYWSSTEGSSLGSWSQTFANGYQLNLDKASGNYVRAVRRIAV